MGEEGGDAVLQVMPMCVEVVVGGSAHVAHISGSKQESHFCLKKSLTAARGVAVFAIAAASPGCKCDPVCLSPRAQAQRDGTRRGVVLSAPHTNTSWMILSPKKYSVDTRACLSWKLDSKNYLSTCL